jgi:hypothetical protein
MQADMTVLLLLLLLLGVFAALPTGVLGVGGPAAAAGAGLLLDGAAGPLKVSD